MEIASYFITDRLGRNDREDFLRAVTRQLASLAGRDAGTTRIRPEDFPELCEAAAKACQDRGQRLVLLVDGLDEDRGASSGGLSIAALLPRNPPASMRIVVTGRPSPPIPDDVPPDHPLRAPGIIRALAPWPHAAGISSLARRELDRLLDDEQAGVPLLGLLVAARGSLTATDLARLVGLRPYRVDRLLRGITGRSFIPGTHGQVLISDLPTGKHPHVLGHEELRREALTALGDVTRFEEQLHAWAEDYRAQGWPSDTPSYLLYDYPRMLHSSGDSERLTAIVLDPYRQRALLERASLDTAYSEIELSAQMVRDRRPGDLGDLAALAACSAMLTERARSLPPSLPVAFARLGYPQRAIEFALAAPDPALKAVCLAKVARALAGTDDQHAIQAAREAARWAGRARDEASPPNGDEYDAEAAVGEAAVALIAIGDHKQGLELLTSLSAPRWAGDETLSCVATAEAALAARPYNPALAEKLLSLAEEYADEVASSSPSNPSAPVTAWSAVAVAVAADDMRAARLNERISQYAKDFPSKLLACMVHAAAASALVANRPEQAKSLAQQATRNLEHALRAPEVLPTDDVADLNMFLGHMLTYVVRALVDTGSVDQACQLMALVPEARRIGLLGTDVRTDAQALIAETLGNPDEESSIEALAKQACSLAEQNRPAEASRRLSQALEALGSPQPGVRPRETWLIPLCTALAAIGRHTESAQLARSLSGAAEQVQALAASAISTMKAGNVTDARRLAREAADLTQALEDTGNSSFFEGALGMNVTAAMGAAAQALAHVGEKDRALSLVEETGSAGSKKQWSALVSVAAGLRSHEPATTADIIDRQRKNLLAMEVSPQGSQGLIAELSELFVAIGGVDAECTGRILRAVEQVFSRIRASNTPLDAEDLLVLLVMGARHQDESAHQTLTKWEHKRADVPPWHLPIASIAIAHAALGDCESAMNSVNNLNSSYDRAEAFTAVAGYLTGTPVVIRDVSISTGAAFSQTFRSLTLSQMPPDAAQTIDSAVPFAAAALAGDGWYHALPILARLAPSAVERVQDIVFTHRRLY
ncbi:hypothetical protein HNR10_004669 [Nocardiopsis aegyptia]|uniref:Uncharacterized protein n=1 Tax=Nocardiopsis aegyptia TaxID=220378 RepID=A0A7Z0ER85_9ACTN|nr:hypothetical protein [Nocardiopsis aegyptia]